MVGSVTRENSIQSHNVPLSVCLSFLPVCLSGHLQLMTPEVPFLFQFIEHVAKDEDRSDGVTACCAGLLG